MNSLDDGQFEKARLDALRLECLKLAHAGDNGRSALAGGESPTSYFIRSAGEMFDFVTGAIVMQPAGEDHVEGEQFVLRLGEGAGAVFIMEFSCPDAGFYLTTDPDRAFRFSDRAEAEKVRDNLVTEAGVEYAVAPVKVLPLGSVSK